MQEVRERAERVARLRAENAAAEQQGAPPSGSPPGVVSAAPALPQGLPTGVKVNANFGPAQHKNVLRAMLTKLLVPHLGEDDVNFLYPRKQSVAMEAMGMDFDLSDDRVSFEKYYHDATMKVRYIASYITLRFAMLHYTAPPNVTLRR